MAIPGTHDSGALYDPPYSGRTAKYTSKAQDLDIAQQLKIGVRFLDIRCKIAGNSLAIHHGAVYQKQMFGDVLNQVVKFLKDNPSEFVFLSVRKEDPKDSSVAFEHILKTSYFNYFYYRTMLYNNDSKFKASLHSGNQQETMHYDYETGTFPKLKDVRGKIVLIKRFNGFEDFGYSVSSGWKDNGSDFTIYSVSQIFKIQDYYNVSLNSKKWNFIQDQLGRARKSNNSSELYLNFFSGSYKDFLGIPHIDFVSKEINPKVYDWFSSIDKYQNTGICIFDLIEEKYSRVIVDVNFKVKMTPR